MIAVIVVAVGALLLQRLADQGPETFGRKKEEKPKAPGAGHARSAIVELVVRLGPDLQEKSGIETVPLKTVTHQGRVRAYGTVLGVGKLVADRNGYMIALAQLQSSQAKLKASKAAYERAKNLLKLFNTALAQVEAAEAAFRTDTAGVVAAESQTRAIESTAVQDWGPVLGKSIADGSPTIDGLIDRRTCLVQVSLRPGTMMSPPPRISLRSGSTSSFGEADYLSPATQVDPKIQGVGFLYTSPCDPGLLPGMSVLALLPAGPPRDAVMVPASAIVWQGGRAWAYLRSGADTFRRQPIPLGVPPEEDGGYVLPPGSLPQGVRLVVQGAQELLSEEARSRTPAAEDDK